MHVRAASSLDRDPGKAYLGLCIPLRSTQVPRKHDPRGTENTERLIRTEFHSVVHGSEGSVPVDCLVNPFMRWQDSPLSCSTSWETVSPK